MHALLHTLRNDASTRGMPGPRALLPLAVLAGAWLGSPIAGQQPRFQELRRSVPADAGESLSLALADVDGDGDLDALLGNEIGAQLLINDGTAVFRDASSNLPGGLFGTRDVAFGDFDGDGDADVLTTNRQLLLNDGSGQFVDGSANVVGGFGTGTSLALGDLDGDGDLDAVRGLNGGIATVWLNAGHGLLVDTAAGFPTGVFGTTQDAVLGDVDGDGILDLFLARGTQDLLFLGDGAGAFVDATSRLPVNPESTSAAAMADLDGDGDLDLLLSNDDAPRLWLNDGTGAFRDAPGNVPDFASYAPTTTRIVLEDVDGDGDRDAYLAHSRFRNILLLNDGGAGFTDASDRLPERQDATFGMALADLDGDGDVDALLANHRAFAASTQTRLQLNDGSGNFRDVTTEFPNLARSSRLGALGDLDGDGDLDALLAGAAGDFVYENDGTGTFEPDPLALPPGYLSATSIALGDLDGDGDLDAVLGALDFLGYGGGTGYAGAGTSESSRNNRLYRNDGSGHFEDGTTLLPPGFRANDVALGDVDGDGDLDAALACIEIAYVGYGSQVLVAAPNALLLNDGSGAFADGSANLPPLAELSLALALTDLDRDGDLDLYVGNAGPDHLFLNDGSGAFVDASSGLPTRPVYTPEVVAGDVDGDGDTDLLLVESSPRILLNDGSARFQEAPSPFPTVANPNTAALLDVDEDGDLDVLFGAPWGNRLLHNDGRGAFTDASSELPGGYARTTAFAPGDVDGDGDPDVLVVSDAYPEVEDRLFVNVSRGIAHRGAPRVGQPLRMDLYGTPGAPWILARAPEPAQVPLGALGTLFLAPGRLRFVATGRLDATGRASWSAPVPPDPELVGRSVDWQALVGSPNRLTNRDRTTLGG